MGSKAVKGNKIANQVLRDSGIRESKSSSDTVRVWENYREQALLWRALALLELPTTLVAIVFAFLMWKNADVTIHVPQKPLPGYYLANEIPKDEFISVATDFLNLIATYQPRTARRQFEKAAEYLVEPMLTKFENEMLGRELTAIETTNRTQIYYVNPIKTRFFRLNEKTVMVAISGERMKIISGGSVPDTETMYKVQMKTIPRNPINKYGIVITQIQSISEPTALRDQEKKLKKLKQRLKKEQKG